MSFMSADVHHRDDDEFVGEIHIGYSTLPDSVGAATVVARLVMEDLSFNGFYFVKLIKRILTSIVL